MEQPTIYTTEEALKPNPKWFLTWRIIYPLLGLVLVVELILGLKTLLAPLPKVGAQRVRPISEAQIFLVSSKANFKVRDQIPVTVRVSTGGHYTAGTDLVLRYDPKILELTPNSIIKGKIYSDFPLVSVDGKKGIIRISGIASNTKQAFNGIGDFGTINFKAKAAGQTYLNIDFKKGETNDSNVFSSNGAEDLLGAGSSLKLTIQ